MSRGIKFAGCTTTDYQTYTWTDPLTREKFEFVRQGNIILGEKK